MNHNDSPLVHSNRSASRRLHRRAALSVVSPCVVGSNMLARTSCAVLSLPKALVAEAGMFELMAAELRIAELESALAEAREVACIDPLTGALNRRGFDKACQRELARARRSGARFALAHIDLDDFKQLNDTLGHQAGDKALVHLVELLHKSMRPSDVLCRFGGEEFVLMLPDTELDDAAAAVSRFLSEFSAQTIPGTDCVMTFSSGVVTPDHAESLEEAIRRADAATYAAKRAGKNRVVSC
jgi:diguanylate cyclase